MNAHCGMRRSNSVQSWVGSDLDNREGNEVPVDTASKSNSSNSRQLVTDVLNAN